MIIDRDLAHTSPEVFFGAQTWSKTNNLRAVSCKSFELVLDCSMDPKLDDVGAINGSTRVCICCTNGRNDDGCSVMSSMKDCSITRIDELWAVSDGLCCFAMFRHAVMKAAREGVVISRARD